MTVVGLPPSRDQAMSQKIEERGLRVPVRTTLISSVFFARSTLLAIAPLKLRGPYQSPSIAKTEAATVSARTSPGPRFPDVPVALWGASPP